MLSLSIFEYADALRKAKDASFYLENASEFQFYCICKLNLINEIMESEAKTFKKTISALSFFRKTFLFNEYSSRILEKEIFFASDLDEIFQSLSEFNGEIDLKVELIGKITDKTTIYKFNGYFWILNADFSFEYLRFNANLNCFYTSASLSAGNVGLFALKLLVKDLKNSGF